MIIVITISEKRTEDLFQGMPTIKINGNWLPKSLQKLYFCKEKTTLHVLFLRNIIIINKSYPTILYTKYIKTKILYNKYILKQVLQK